MANAAFVSSPQIATFLSKSSSSSSFHFQPRFSSLSLPVTPSFSPIITTPRKSILFQTNSKLLLPLPVAAAASEDVAVDATEQLVSTTDDGVSVIVSVLFFLAFIGLSVITVGVIYLAVTDFLTKREKDKFEKREANREKKKKSKLKKQEATIAKKKKRRK